MVDGQRVGGKSDVAAFGPDSYEHTGVPPGKLSEKIVHSSKIYEGMQTNYWIYVPAQYDPGQPAALMVWQDGQGRVQRDGAARSQIVFDNLTYQKKIPVMIHVFIQPGTVGARAMRSIEYDTVSDKYARFLRDEVLPESTPNMTSAKDGYSRGISGSSSGGICAFNVAWWQPEQFSRVLSISAASPAFNGIPARLTAAMSIHSRSARSPSATSASGCRTEPKIWRTTTEAGRYRTCKWPTPSR